ncbi:MAG: helix-turn-helix domain-containing protein [Desulfomicrobium sp.]|nr:helix-turn-helix domain-containing protein [Desulfomicrobium sp.]
MNAKKLQNYLEGDVPRNIGERIDLFLLTKNITRAKLGEALGVTGTTIASYCTGKSKPNSDFLEAAANVFDLNPMWLLIGAGPMILTEDEHGCSFRVEEESDDYQAQVLELKHELADKDRELASVERAMGKQQSLILEAVRKACREQGLATEQSRAIQWAVLDYEGAMDSGQTTQDEAVSHQQAVGD